MAGCSASLTGRARIAVIEIVAEFQWPYTVIASQSSVAPMIHIELPR